MEKEPNVRQEILNAIEEEKAERMRQLSKFHINELKDEIYRRSSETLVTLYKDKDTIVFEMNNNEGDEK
jgi:hypothetical protein